MTYQIITCAKALSASDLAEMIEQAGFDLLMKLTGEFWGRCVLAGIEFQIRDLHGEKFGPDDTYSQIRIESEGELPDSIFKTLEQQFA